MYATVAHNLKPMSTASGEYYTRLEEGTGKKVLLSTMPMLPFGLPLVVKTLKPTKDGRGNCGIFIGTSETVPRRVSILCYST